MTTPNIWKMNNINFEKIFSGWLTFNNCFFFLIKTRTSTIFYLHTWKVNSVQMVNNVQSHFIKAGAKQWPYLFENSIQWGDRSGSGLAIKSCPGFWNFWTKLGRIGPWP